MPWMLAPSCCPLPEIKDEGRSGRRDNDDPITCSGPDFGSGFPKKDAGDDGRDYPLAYKFNHQAPPIVVIIFYWPERTQTAGQGDNSSICTLRSSITGYARNKITYLVVAAMAQSATQRSRPVVLSPT